MTTCEKTFVTRVIGERKRLDGRKLDEHRKVRLNFGTGYGSVQVSLGETRCLAKITCEVGAPKNARPHEGQMFINVEFGPMAAAHYEPGKQPEMAVLISRILERAFSDSRCVDLESLCIVSEEKAWHLRIDVAILNDDGNVCDCASYAVLAALHHFRRPDVTTTGDSIVVHTDRERDPIPLVLHHFPVCVSFAIFESGEFSIADPTALEERVAQSSLVFGLNSYQELCGLHLGGIFLTSADLMIRTASRAAKQAKYMVDVIRRAVEADTVAREAGQKISFMQSIQQNKIKSSEQDRIFVKLKKMRKIEKKIKADAEGSDNEMAVEDWDGVQEVKAADNVDSMDVTEGEDENQVVKLSEKTAVLMAPGKWIPDNEDDDDDVDDAGAKG